MRAERFGTQDSFAASDLMELALQSVDPNVFLTVWQTRLEQCPPENMVDMALGRLLFCTINGLVEPLRELLAGGEGALLDCYNKYADHITPILSAAKGGRYGSRQGVVPERGDASW